MDMDSRVNGKVFRRAWDSSVSSCRNLNYRNDAVSLLEKGKAIVGAIELPMTH